MGGRPKREIARALTAAAASIDKPFVSSGGGRPAYWRTRGAETNVVLGTTSYILEYALWYDMYGVIAPRAGGRAEVCVWKGWVHPLQSAFIGIGSGIISWVMRCVGRFCRFYLILVLLARSLREAQLGCCHGDIGQESAAA